MLKISTKIALLIFIDAINQKPMRSYFQLVMDLLGIILNLAIMNRLTNKVVHVEDDFL